MENTDLFTAALRLGYPWKVSKVEFPPDDDPQTMTLHITIGLKGVPNSSFIMKNSGFALLFEAWVMELSKHLPVSVIAKLIGVYDKRLRRFIKYYVSEARKLEDYSDVENIGMDETSQKGYNYITVMVDTSKRKVIFTTEGKDHTTVDKFVEDFKEHNGDPDNVKVITCDMSLGFKKVVKDNFRTARQ